MSQPIKEHIEKAEAERVAAEAAAAVGRVEDLPTDDAFGVLDTPPPLVPPGDNAREPDPPASAVAPPADEEVAERELSGKRVVQVYDLRGTGWELLSDPAAGVVGMAAPLLYDGDRDSAIRAALDDERNEALADAVRNDPARFLLVSIPASSWAPAHVKPRVMKTTWAIAR